jgi:hypothetical protein
MTKRLSAITGEYVSKQDNQQKGEWTNVGVLIIGQNGKEYAMLDPAVNLAGILLQQNLLALKKGEAPRDMVMLSVFDDVAQQGQQQGNQQSYQPQPQGQQQGFNQPQGGFNQPQGNYPRR